MCSRAERMTYRTLAAEDSYQWQLSRVFKSADTLIVDCNVCSFIPIKHERITIFSSWQTLAALLLSMSIVLAVFN